MIARIKGILIHKSVSHVIVDAHGVGYQIFVPLTTFYELPETGQSVILNIYTHVKEDALHLYGFHTLADQGIFQMLISVVGIGPKLALNILSGIPAREFIRAVTQGNLGRLVAIPGVGKKTAERMVLELKDRMLKIDFAPVAPEGVTDEGRDDAVKDDALSALVNLGYKQAAAGKAIDGVVAGLSGDLSLDVLLREALKRLSG
ncbi:MAG: Holliday junction branch migration protein RuvA [Syntrophus sp. (in: bacteria)]|nr:Holliday junction branch migration protein RuvA [Syntrophus sp. (in: bacteria)]